MCKLCINKQEGYYARLFSKFYDKILHSAEKSILGKHRQELLTSLKGQVLEVGCGTGVNFDYYSKAVKVIALEPSKSMLDQARAKNTKSKINITFMHSEFQEHDFHQKFDSIVCTLVLCTIPDCIKTIQSLSNLLKKGGKLIILEHIRSHNPVIAFLQRMFRFPWKIIGQGCILNQNTDQLLVQEKKLHELESMYFTSSLPFYRAIFEKK